MNSNLNLFWGIDVSKEWIDISVGNQAHRVNQTKKDINQFIKKKIKLGIPSLAVLESTGGYEILAADLLNKSGVTVHIAHPNRVRNFAKAKGYLAKTDRIDAMVLAQYGAFIEPKDIRDLPSKLQRQLSELSSRLTQLKGMHHQESCRSNMANYKTVKQSHKKILTLLDKQMESIEKEMMSLIQNEKDLIEKYNLLQSMKGVGTKLALSLIADLPELGKASKKEIAALVGVAPIINESGKQRGRSMIRHGRHTVRKMLYMGALSAVRHDETMKEFYNRLLAKGKAKKVALVAVMRKMLVVMNVMVTKNKPYLPTNCTE